MACDMPRAGVPQSARWLRHTMGNRRAARCTNGPRVRSYAHETPADAACRDDEAMIAANQPGPRSRVNRRPVRTARGLVLALLTVWLLAACGSPNTDLCKQAANQLTLAELDEAALTYARVEREDPNGCGQLGLDDVAQASAQMSVAVARGVAAENAGDYLAAKRYYTRALQLNADNGTAISGFKRVAQTSSDVAPIWRVAMSWHDLAVVMGDPYYDEQALKAIAKVKTAHPDAPIPVALTTVTTRPASSSTTTTAAGAQTDVLGAEALPQDLSGAADTSGTGPGFFTRVGWTLAVLIGMVFLVVVVLSRGGNEHVIPRTVSGVAVLVERFTPRPAPTSGTQTTLPRASSSPGAARNETASRTGTPTGTPNATPEAPTMDSSLIAAEISDPASATFTPAPIPMSQAIDNTAGVAAARPTPPRRWRTGGLLKRFRLTRRDDLSSDPEVAAAESQPQLLPGRSELTMPSRTELLSRVILLERRDRTLENKLARISSRKDAEVTSVLVTSSHTPWQAVRNGNAPRMIVIDTRVFWSGSGRESYTPGSIVVRQTTSTVDDAQRDALLSLAVPAPMEDSTWHTVALTGLLDGLTAAPGDGHWTRWLESPSHIRYESVVAGQGSLTDQWRAIVMHEKVSVSQSDVALASLLPLSGNGDVQLRTTHRIRDVVESLGLDAGALLPVGRQVYALQLVLTSDLVTSIAAVERSVSADALSQAISREVLDTLGSDLGVVGTDVIDVLAGAGRGTARRLALRQVLDGVRKELSDAAAAHS